MSLADEIGKRVIDQSAETCRELCQATGYSPSWARERAAEQIRTGQWERVWKRVGRNLVPAYRRAKRK